MQQLDNRLILSATDLINYLECPHLTHLDMEVALGRIELEPTRTDATALVARKGDEHERAYLAQLQADGHEVVEIESEPGLHGSGSDDSERGLDGLRRGAERTVAAMLAGAEVIYQGVLFDGVRWRGYSDFLQRVERPSELGSFSYEVADTKLARRVSHISCCSCASTRSSSRRSKGSRRSGCMWCWERAPGTAFDERSSSFVLWP